MNIYFFGPDYEFVDTAFLDPNAVPGSDLPLDILSASATQIVTRNIVSGAVTTFDGTGFAFRGEDVVGGTINSVTFRQGGTTVARVEGISWSAVAFVDALIDIVDFDDWSAFDALMNASAPITYDATAATNPGHADFLGLAVPVTYLGSAFGDYVRGTASGDRLEGRDGDDRIQGLGGDDTLLGGDGADMLDGGAGNDEFWTGAGNDSAIGGTGADMMGGGGGDDEFWAGGGDDLLYGGDGDDSLGAGAGNDTIWAGAGDDLIYGGDGDDRIGAGLGADEIWTGAGADLAYGGPGINRIGGGAGNDTLWGGADGDSIYGGNDDDALGGGGGDDNVWGGNGDDLLRGGAGDDTLGGGAGADTFVFAAGSERDLVLGFTDDVDTLRLDDSLWSGTLTAAEVVTNFATVSGGNTVFDFGGGDLLVLQGVTNLSILADDIDIV